MGFRDRLKAETDKYQQKFFGSSEPSSQQLADHANPSNNSPSTNQHHTHIDTQKLCFDGRPHPQPQPYDAENNSCPIQIASTTEMGSVHSMTSTIKRDLGFAGQIGSYVLLSYGDTIYSIPCPSDIPYPKNLTYDDGVFRGMTSNSVAIATHDPLAVIDPPATLNELGYPDQFVKINKDWGEEMATHAVGITNVIETNAQRGEGVIFTLLNHRPEGKDHILGAGVATVKLTFPNGTDVPVPVAHRQSPFMWDGDTEPHWGDVGAVRDESHIYVYGHRKDNPWIYLARVKVEDVLKVECYEYWHGKTKGWSADRLRGELGEEQSVFWQVNQGQVVWSPYYKRYLFFYCDNFWSSSITVRSAPVPEGPWGPEKKVVRIEPITEGGTIYSAAPQVQYDQTGKTVVVGFTNHPNVIQTVKVVFE